MQDVFSSFTTSVRSFHAHRSEFQDHHGTQGARIRIPQISWSRIALVIVLAFLLTGGFHGGSADGATTGRIQVSARVLSVGTLSQTTTQLEREWEDQVAKETLQRDLATLGLAESWRLHSGELTALARRWNGEKNVGNGVVRFEFALPRETGGNPLLQIEWISN